MKRILKISLVALTSIALILVLSLVAFLYKHDAPIIYGDMDYDVPFNEKRALDVYYPTKVLFEKSPVILYFHGGGWVSGLKEMANSNRFNQAFKTLRENGYTIISADYTLASVGKSPFPDNVTDGYDAIEWIKNHADTLGLDLNNFGIMGESAGGHIAMLNAFAHPSVFGLNYSKTKFNYVVDVYGPIDMFGIYETKFVDSLKIKIKELPEFMQNTFDIPHLLYGFNPEDSLALAKKLADFYSPIYYLTAETKLPTLMIHGKEDFLVPYAQTERIKAKLDSLNGQSELHGLEGVNHAFAGASDETKSQIQNWISDFIINQYLPPKS
jgi:acetyl esterase/lipase